MSGAPGVNTVSLGAPFGWLAAGLRDFAKAPGPCLVYGAALALFSAWMLWALIESDAAFWVIALTCGFVFVAPMLAMGLYEAGRMIDAGERPSLSRMLFVRGALRQDVAYLGLALLLIYLLWGRFAQIVYGLSTFRLHRTVEEFVAFAVATSEGHTMLIAGSLVGGVFAFFTFALVVVSAPMLLDQSADVFTAAFTSLRATARNFGAMMVWAFLITALILLSAATGFLALVVIFPWLGLASWRAYRALVVTA